MTNGQNVARSRHLEELANAAKRYTLREILDVTEAVATELGGLSIANSYTLPTASTSQKGGVKIGSGLQMDGDTLNVTIQSGSSGGTVLDTVPTTVDGVLWYEVTDNVPTLWLHKGNYDYGYTGFNRQRFTGTADEHLVAYLPFDISPTFDACGNEWTAYGSPTVANTNAFSGKALQLDGSNYLQLDNFVLGGQDFTIDCWAYIKSNSETYARLFDFAPFAKRLNVYRNYGTLQMGLQNIQTESQSSSMQVIASTATLNALHHYVAVYVHATGTNYFFIDGVLIGSFVNEMPRRTDTLRIGADNSTGGSRLVGAIDHFRIFDGVALWTENFTPPTADDYL